MARSVARDPRSEVHVAPAARVAADERATAALHYAELRLAIELARHGADLAETELALLVEQCQRIETAMLNRLVTVGVEGAIEETLEYGEAAANVALAQRRLEDENARLGEMQLAEARALEHLASFSR